MGDVQFGWSWKSQVTLTRSCGCWDSKGPGPARAQPSRIPAASLLLTLHLRTRPLSVCTVHVTVVVSNSSWGGRPAPHCTRCQHLVVPREEEATIEQDGEDHVPRNKCSTCFGRLRSQKTQDTGGSASEEREGWAAPAAGEQ